MQRRHANTRNVSHRAELQAFTLGGGGSCQTGLSCSEDTPEPVFPAFICSHYWSDYPIPPAGFA